MKTVLVLGLLALLERRVRAAAPPTPTQWREANIFSSRLIEQADFAEVPKDHVEGASGTARTKGVAIRIKDQRAMHALAAMVAKGEPYTNGLDFWILPTPLISFYQDGKQTLALYPQSPGRLLCLTGPGFNLRFTPGQLEEIISLVSEMKKSSTPAAKPSAQDHFDYLQKKDVDWNRMPPLGT